jgi:DNA-binding CsgD family transcriptional regulator
VTEPDQDNPIEMGLRRLNVSLSPLLRYVLAMVCVGKTDDEIAAALTVTRRTASNYVSRLFAATKTTNRPALVAEVLGGLAGVKRAEKLAAMAWRKALVVVRRAKP